MIYTILDTDTPTEEANIIQTHYNKNAERVLIGVQSCGKTKYPLLGKMNVTNSKMRHPLPFSGTVENSLVK